MSKAVVCKQRCFLWKENPLHSVTKEEMVVLSQQPCGVKHPAETSF
jgi:hypothetical protein